MHTYTIWPLASLLIDSRGAQQPCSAANAIPIELCYTPATLTVALSFSANNAIRTCIKDVSLDCW